MERIQERLEIAKKAAHSAAEIQLKHFGTQLVLDFKSEKDFATKVDYECEKVIMKIIQEVFPEDGILGEEEGVTEGTSRFIWIIDPLDGTVNYAHGFPHFCTIIGLWDIEKNEAVLGLVYDPLSKKMYTALKGQGAFMNGAQINVSAYTKIEECFISLGSYDIDPNTQKQQHERYQKLHGSVHSFLRARVTGSAGIDLAFIAEGISDVHVVYGTHPWDHLGPALIVTEAGGVSVDRNLDVLGLESRGIIATNGHVFDAVLKLIQ